MRLTIRRNLALGFGLLLLLFLVSGLLVDWGLRQTAAQLDYIVTTAEPLSAAAYELEINALGTGLGVMQYLETGAAQSRERMAKGQKGFASSLATYRSLASTPQAQELGVRAGHLYDEFRTLGAQLIWRHDQQERVLPIGANLSM